MAGRICSKYRRWNTYVVWAVLGTVLFGGAFPPMGLCLCEDCDCPANVSRPQRTDTDPPACHGTCCPQETTRSLPQSRCGSSTSGKCRCSENTGFRILAIRPSVHQQRDNAKKPFGDFSWKVIRVISSFRKGTTNIVRGQYAPHVLLPRLHLLFSVFIN